MLVVERFHIHQNVARVITETAVRLGGDLGYRLALIPRDDIGIAVIYVISAVHREVIL